ncbi:MULTISPECIES: hypothetical protein [Clostridium]|uniref:Uncharacterized protein n=1 Tax=Clostridium ragsdalei P11 TaxID=1353534 RepID=A0A1A6AW18_9CLOT|nr:MULTISPECIES: hypothetical protein [Clostridium]OBR94242.1 hypothetical protein CLRAG_16330 [Clostridium ragsdalei P11]
MAKLQETKTPLVMNLQLFADTKPQQGDPPEQQNEAFMNKFYEN